MDSLLLIQHQKEKQKIEKIESFVSTTNNKMQK